MVFNERFEYNISVKNTEKPDANNIPASLFYSETFYNNWLFAVDKCDEEGNVISTEYIMGVDTSILMVGATLIADDFISPQNDMSSLPVNFTGEARLNFAWFQNGTKMTSNSTAVKVKIIDDKMFSDFTGCFYNDDTHVSILDVPMQFGPNADGEGRYHLPDLSKMGWCFKLDYTCDQQRKSLIFTPGDYLIDNQFVDIDNRICYIGMTTAIPDPHRKKDYRPQITFQLSCKFNIFYPQSEGVINAPMQFCSGLLADNFTKTLDLDEKPITKLDLKWKEIAPLWRRGMPKNYDYVSPFSIAGLAIGCYKKVGLPPALTKKLQTRTGNLWAAMKRVCDFQGTQIGESGHVYQNVGLVTILPPLASSHDKPQYRLDCYADDIWNSETNPNKQPPKFDTCLKYSIMGYISDIDDTTEGYFPEIIRDCKHMFPIEPRLKQPTLWVIKIKNPKGEWIEYRTKNIEDSDDFIPTLIVDNFSCEQEGHFTAIAHPQDGTGKHPYNEKYIEDNMLNIEIPVEYTVYSNESKYHEQKIREKRELLNMKLKEMYNKERYIKLGASTTFGSAAVNEESIKIASAMSEFYRISQSNTTKEKKENSADVFTKTMTKLGVENFYANTKTGNIAVLKIDRCSKHQYAKDPTNEIWPNEMKKHTDMRLFTMSNGFLDANIISKSKWDPVVTTFPQTGDGKKYDVTIQTKVDKLIEYIPGELYAEMKNAGWEWLTSILKKIWSVLKPIIVDKLPEISAKVTNYISDTSGGVFELVTENGIPSIICDTQYIVTCNPPKSTKNAKRITFNELKTHITKNKTMSRSQAIIEVFGKYLIESSEKGSGITAINVPLDPQDVKIESSDTTTKEEHHVKVAYIGEEPVNGQLGEAIEKVSISNNDITSIYTVPKDEAKGVVFTKNAIFNFNDFKTYALTSDQIATEIPENLLSVTGATTDFTGEYQATIHHITQSRGDISCTLDYKVINNAPIALLALDSTDKYAEKSKYDTSTLDIAGLFYLDDDKKELSSCVISPNDIVVTDIDFNKTGNSIVNIEYTNDNKSTIKAKIPYEITAPKITKITAKPLKDRFTIDESNSLTTENFIVNVECDDNSKYIANDFIITKPIIADDGKNIITIIYTEPRTRIEYETTCIISVYNPLMYIDFELKKYIIPINAYPKITDNAIVKGYYYSGVKKNNTPVEEEFTNDKYNISTYLPSAGGMQKIVCNLKNNDTSIFNSTKEIYIIPDTIVVPSEIIVIDPKHIYALNEKIDVAKYRPTVKFNNGTYIKDAPEYWFDVDVSDNYFILKLKGYDAVTLKIGIKRNTDVISTLKVSGDLNIEYGMPLDINIISNSVKIEGITTNNDVYTIEPKHCHYGHLDMWTSGKQDMYIAYGKSSNVEIAILNDVNINTPEYISIFAKMPKLIFEANENINKDNIIVSARSNTGYVSILDKTDYDITISDTDNYNPDGKTSVVTITYPTKDKLTNGNVPLTSRFEIIVKGTGKKPNPNNDIVGIFAKYKKHIAYIDDTISKDDVCVIGIKKNNETIDIPTENWDWGLPKPEEPITIEGKRIFIINYNET